VVSNKQSITLLTSSPSMPSNGSKPVTIQAIVRNASNQLVTGAAVSFSATSGGITPVATTAGAAATPAVAAGTTDSNGIAAATLSPAGDPTNRTITVTATLGSTTATVSVGVTGTALTVGGPTSLIQGAAGTYTAVLLDSGGSGISNATVKFASSAGNTLGAATATTNQQGQAAVTLTATASASSDTLTATALGLTAAQVVSVSNQSFNFTAPAPSTAIVINQPQTVTLVWTSGGAPQANTAVSFSTTRGVFSGGAVTTSAMTDVTGTATVSVSSTTAGPATITGTATQPGTGAQLTAQLPLQFDATTPASIDVQASPSTIATQGTSAITAIVRDASGNLVANQTVDFQLTDVTGGSLSAGSAVTNVQGQAQVVYTASSTQSASNGVQIKATVQGSSVPPQIVDLTVGGQTVFLSLGTGSIIGENTAKTQFLLPYIVQALDAGGNPVANAVITLTVHSLPPFNPVVGGVQYAPTSPNYLAESSAYAAYWKGSYTLGASAWIWTPVTGGANGCLNEDANGNGVYDVAEDLNQNGRLDPGDVAAVSPGSITTDSTGSGNMIISYPESYANWVQVKLTATATVSGTQTSVSRVFQLPILATYLTTTTSSPPGYVSPFGSLSPSCASTQ
jgi:hypothetical protein